MDTVNTSSNETLAHEAVGAAVVAVVATIAGTLAQMALRALLRALSRRWNSAPAPPRPPPAPPRPSRARRTVTPEAHPGQGGPQASPPRPARASAGQASVVARTLRGVQGDGQPPRLVAVPEGPPVANDARCPGQRCTRRTCVRLPAGRKQGRGMASCCSDPTVRSVPSLGGSGWPARPSPRPGHRGRSRRPGPRCWCRRRRSPRAACRRWRPAGPARRRPGGRPPIDHTPPGAPQPVRCERPLRLALQVPSAAVRAVLPAAHLRSVCGVGDAARPGSGSDAGVYPPERRRRWRWQRRWRWRRRIRDGRRQDRGARRC